MRQYIRHPTDIPINCAFDNQYYCIHNLLMDVSAGGLSFLTESYIPPGEHVHVNIYVQNPSFASDCEVKWCNPAQEGYHVGVRFLNASEAFSFRMVEQVCHIEHYKRVVFDKEGRRLNGEEAAQEWIQKYAHQFPR